MLAAARDEYVSEASRGRAGRTVVARYADRLDVLIGGLVAQARDETTVAVAVCAVGGYGRRALCLHSDLDLLIVFNGEIGPAEERFVKAVLQPLWDLRLEIGQHVRELAELDDIDLGNPEFLLSLLDVRPLAGDSETGMVSGPRALRLTQEQAASPKGLVAPGGPSALLGRGPLGLGEVAICSPPAASGPAACRAGTTRRRARPGSRSPRR